MLKIAVVDGMGGGIGSQLISQLRQELENELEIIALGTNSTATTIMIKSGANRGATGENAIRVNLKNVDCVIGPIGIIIPDALMGEITKDIAQEIMSQNCRKILLPIHQLHIELIGLENRPLNQVIKDAVLHIRKIQQEKASGTRGD